MWDVYLSMDINLLNWVLSWNTMTFWQQPSSSLENIDVVMNVSC
jgi:hypothetical protein